MITDEILALREKYNAMALRPTRLYLGHAQFSKLQGWFKKTQLDDDDSELKPIDHDTNPEFNRGCIFGMTVYSVDACDHISIGHNLEGE